MKKLKLILITALCGFSTIALAQNANNASSDSTSGKKMLLGAGITTSDITAGVGANLKFDYLLNNRFRVGLKSIFSTNGWDDYTSPADQYSKGFSVDYKSGNVFNVMVNSTFYILGNNSSESKGGVYTTVGVGYSAWKMSETVTSLAPSNDNSYYKYSKNWGSSTFIATMIGIGGDRKLGPGRIYFEIPVVVDIYGTTYDKYTSQKWNSSSNIQPNNKYTGFRHFNNSGLFLVLGYHIYF